MEKLVNFENNYIEECWCENNDGDDSLLKAYIDGYEEDEDKEGSVVAVVALTKGGDIVIDWHLNAYRETDQLKEMVEETKTMLLQQYEDVKEKIRKKKRIWEKIQNKLSSDIRIRPLRYEDKDAVIEMDELSGNDVQQWVDDLKDEPEDSWVFRADNAYGWGCFKNGELIGYCTVGGADDFDEAKNSPEYSFNSLLLSDVYIKKEYRSNGYALRMIRNVLSCRTRQAHESVFISLLYDELSGLYKKAGFRWAYDEEAYIMVRPSGN